MGPNAPVHSAATASAAPPLTLRRNRMLGFNSKDRAIIARTSIVLSWLFLASAAHAADPAKAACEAQAVDKKLAGAAKNSFMKKCEKDAAAK